MVASDLSLDGCCASIVDIDVAIISLRLCQIVLLDSRHCGCALVVKWLGLGKFGKVKSGRL